MSIPAISPQVLDSNNCNLVICAWRFSNSSTQGLEHVSNSILANFLIRLEQNILLRVVNVESRGLELALVEQVIPLLRAPPECLP